MKYLKELRELGASVRLDSKGGLILDEYNPPNPALGEDEIHMYMDIHKNEIIREIFREHATKPPKIVKLEM